MGFSQPELSKELDTTSDFTLTMSSKVVEQTLVVLETHKWTLISPNFRLSYSNFREHVHSSFQVDMYLLI